MHKYRVKVHAGTENDSQMKTKELIPNENNKGLPNGILLPNQ